MPATVIPPLETHRSRAVISFVPCLDDVVLWICLHLDQVCRRGSRLECFEDTGIFSSVSAVVSWSESKDMCNKHCYVSQAPGAPKQNATLLCFIHFELVNILFWGLFFFVAQLFKNTRRAHCVYMWRQQTCTYAWHWHIVKIHTSHSPPLTQAATCRETRGTNKKPVCSVNMLQRRNSLRSPCM